MAAVRHVLIPVSGPLETLLDGAEAAAVVQGASYTVSVARGISLTCSSSSCDQVNERASKLAGFSVQGDAALCVQLDQDIGFAEYLETHSFSSSAMRGTGGNSQKPFCVTAGQGAEGCPESNASVCKASDEQQSPEADLQQHDHLSSWGDLPEELLCKIMAAGIRSGSAGELVIESRQGFDPSSGNAAVLLAAAGVCSGWRNLLLSADSLLKEAQIYINTGRPFVGALSHTPPMMIRRIKCPPLPLVVTKAAALGNGSAAFACGALLDLQGKGDTAVRFWRRAAKSGYRKAQLRIGEAFYRGTDNMPRDAEEAILWLNRVVRGLEEKPTEHCPVAADACLLLGFLHFDGEGVAMDQEEAVRLFRRSAAFGSKEAEKNLGWIYNTGQYGTLTRWG